jgi:Domain of unknown function (DUF4383)
MNARSIARILASLFLAIGIAGLVPQLAPAAPFDAQVITLDAAYRMLLGIFPVNAALDGLHVLVGLWGLLAGARLGFAVFYSRCVMWVFLLLALFGAIPITNTLIGVAPIYGWNIALNAIVALVAAYAGYGRGALPPPEPAPTL